MMPRVLRSYYVVLYYLSWFFFALGALALAALCLPLFPFRASGALQRFTRVVIRGALTAWVWWLRTTGVLRIAWRGFPPTLSAGVVYVANHPTLIDAPLLLSRLPDAMCIFKPSLMRNPGIGIAASVANYPAGDANLDVIRHAAARVAAGQSLLVFPEGTRTAPGSRLGAFKPGFALIARRAGAPVQTIRVHASPDVGRRNQPWWRLPAALPVWIEFTFERCWLPDPQRPAHELAVEIHRHLLERLQETA
jgi:1-acyl-sn-glycerol-3-phosphate acyltransferase